jgi:hypothetical protein
MQEEITNHNNGKHWMVVALDQVPEGTKVLDAVWAMRRKRRIGSGEIYRWKARLNIHGGQQVKEENYWETYAPVVTWPTIRLCLTLAILKGWHTRQTDFVQAYPQAPVETDLYMKIPAGYNQPGISKSTHCLKILMNLYGQKQGGCVWNIFLDQKLKKIGFQVSKLDPCLYYRDNVLFLIYVDDGIWLSPSSKAVDEAIQDLIKASLKIEDQGDLNDYLAVKVEKLQDGRFKLSQPQLIRSLIADLHFQANTKEKQTPAVTTKILDRDPHGAPFDGSFHYRSVIGKLNFLEKSTRPDLAYSVHQCARFSQDPKQSHGDAVKRIVRYLKGTAMEGLILSPDTNLSLHCYVDSDFCGMWKKEDAANNPMTSKSRMGFAIHYSGCTLLWASKIQQQTSLSSTEAEYVALSTAMRDLLPMMDILKELKANKIELPNIPPTIHCKVFEDNSGALELARLPKIRPRTKHINVMYHHFRERVAPQGEIIIAPINSADQPADFLTKPLALESFRRHRKFLMGW